ncbi:hypothetical protein ScPMuIL_017442 [Solemya velum]
MALLRVDDLKEEFLVCDVCKDEFDEDDRIPRVIPCLHTFCQRCIEAVVKDRVLKCPTCRVKHVVPGNDVRNFPKENTRRSLRDFVRLKNHAGDILCKDCPDNCNATHFCKECHAFLCAECKKAHLRNFMSRLHQMVTLEELKDSGLDPFKQSETCKVSGHEGQDLSFYCAAKSCRVPICSMCTAMTHDENKGHAIRKIEDVYGEHKAIIFDLVERLGVKISFSKGVIEETEEELEKLEKKQELLSKEIDIEVDAAVQILEIRRTELKQSLGSCCKEKKNVLDKQNELLKNALASMTSAKDFSVHCIAHSLPAEFVHLTDTMAHRLAELKGQHIEPCPLENAYVSFDKANTGQQFKDFAVEMGKIRSTGIYPPRTLIEPLQAPVNHEAEVLKIFLYDFRGRPQKECADCVYVEITDTGGDVHTASVRDANTVEGCYKAFYKPEKEGVHMAIVRVLGKPVQDKPITFSAKPPGDIDRRFGSIMCPGFMFDSETVHPDRVVTPDKRTMKSDIITPPPMARRVTSLRFKHFRPAFRPKRYRGRAAFPWEIEQTQQKEKETTRGNSDKPFFLTGEKTKTFVAKRRLRKYYGVLGTSSFTSPGRYYFEVSVHYKIHVTLVRNAMIFEIGIGRLDSIYTSITLGNQTFAWSFAAERCSEHRHICHKFRHRRALLLHTPLSSDSAGTTMQITYGLLVDTIARQWAIVEVLSGRVMYVFRGMEFTEPMWPVFGTYNPYSVHVEISLKTGRDIGRIPETLKLV